MVRLLLGVIGLAGLLIALPVMFAGGSLIWAETVLTDSDGFVNSRPLEIEVDGFALVAGTTDIEEMPEIPESPISLGEVATLRIQATSLDESKAIFIGVAPTQTLDNYLGGVTYAVFDDADDDEMFLSYRMNVSDTTLAFPGEQDFWVQSTTGSGAQELQWDLEEGNVSFVIMNEDASDGMAIEAVAGIRVPLIKPVSVGLLVGGGALLALSTLLLALVL